MFVNVGEFFMSPWGLFIWVYLARTQRARYGNGAKSTSSRKTLKCVVYIFVKLCLDNSSRYVLKLSFDNKVVQIETKCGLEK